MPIVALIQAADGAVDPTAFGTLGLRSFLALVVVGALLAATVWGLRRMTGARRSRQLLTVESALSLGDKRSLVVVAVEGRRLLVGVAPGGVSLVTELQQGFASTLAASLDTPDPS
jgi:flagellar protein FliO/FliZ